MSLFNNKKIKSDAQSKANEALFVLSKTHTITDADMASPEWALLRHEYDSPDVVSSIDKLIVSVTNAIITQRRIVFCLTRDTTRNLGKRDKNWKRRAPGLKNEYWKKLLSELYRRGIIALVQPGEGRRLAIYAVIHESLLAVLDVDPDEQCSEVVDFVNKKEVPSVGDDKMGPQRGRSTKDLEVSSEKEEIRTESLGVSSYVEHSIGPESLNKNLSGEIPGKTGIKCSGEIIGAGDTPPIARPPQSPPKEQDLNDLFEKCAAVNKKVNADPKFECLRGEFNLWYSCIRNRRYRDDEGLVRYWIEEYLTQYSCNQGDSIHHFSKAKIKNLQKRELEVLDRNGLLDDDKAS